MYEYVVSYEVWASLFLTATFCSMGNSRFSEFFISDFELKYRAGLRSKK